MTIRHAAVTCGMLAALANSSYAQAPRPAPAVAPRTAPAPPVPPTATPLATTNRPRPRALSLTLVAADMQAGPVSNDVPPAARTALEELKAFLPFKSYTLLDAGVIGAPSDTSPATLRLRGQDTQLFEITIVKPRFPAGALDVVMRDVALIVRSTRGDQLSENLLSANVQLAAGETVIVGTSRIRGDRAIVLLITGLPSTPGSASVAPTAGDVASAPSAGSGTPYVGFSVF